MEWNQMIPELDVFDLEKSLNFYTKLIGFEIVYTREEDRFAFLQMERVQLMIQELDLENNKWECLTKPAKRIKEGTIVSFGNGILKAKRNYNNKFNF